MKKCINFYTDEITIFLINRVKFSGEKAFINYNDLASQFGLPPVDQYWLSHPLSMIFDVIDYEDHIKKRPLLTSLVINQNNSPGDGYFKTAKKLGRFNGSLKCRSDKDQFFIDEFHRLVGYWKKVNSSHLS